jgi:hypothetical protein
MPQNEFCTFNVFKSLLTYIKYLWLFAKKAFDLFVALLSISVPSGIGVARWFILRPKIQIWVYCGGP